MIRELAALRARPICFVDWLRSERVLQKIPRREDQPEEEEVGAAAWAPPGGLRHGGRAVEAGVEVEVVVEVVVVVVVGAKAEGVAQTQHADSLLSLQVLSQHQC